MKDQDGPGQRYDEAQKKPRKPRVDGTVNADEEIMRLAKLPMIDYARQQKAAAAKLDLGVAWLDRLVKAKRAELDGSKPMEPEPPLYEHWNVEPWNDVVDTGILLRAIKEAIRRYLFMAEELAVATALFVMFSWLHERMTHSPMLLVTSAEKESGKTTLLGVLNFLVRRALQSVSISGPALFRSIEKWMPTFLVDEADTALAKNDDLREVINSGWTRGQGAVRCHPDTHEPQVFDSFAPKVVAMKGRDLPDTTLSRSIIIAMKPRRPNRPEEHAEDFDHLDNETFARLRSQLARWAADNIEVIATAKPEIPTGFHNRRRANWKPLLAIAELAGTDSAGTNWKVEAWKAAQTIEKVAAGFDSSIGVQLLAAIKAAFTARGVTEIKSAALIEDLVDDATAPWATWNKGKPISQRQVAKFLKDYEIRPDFVGPKEDRGRGYKLADFEDLFERHLPPDENPEENPESGPGGVSMRAPVHQPANTGTSDDSDACTADTGCTDKKSQKPNNDGLVHACTDRRGGSGGKIDQRAQSKSDDLTYTGPVVDVPDLGADPLDPHGAPVGHGPSGATAAIALDLVAQEAVYTELVYSCMQDSGSTDDSIANAKFRAHLTELGVPPERLEEVFERVVNAALAAR